MFKNYEDGGSIGSPFRRSKRIPISAIETWFNLVGEIYIGTGGPIAYDNSSDNLGRVDCNNAGPADYFDGVLDEFRIYNMALTLEEV